MAIEEITNYTCLWDIDDRRGYIGLFSGVDFKAGHEYTDPMEFMAVLSILRNESPLYYDEENQWVSAGVKIEHEIFQADSGGVEG